MTQEKVILNPSRFIFVGGSLLVFFLFFFSLIYIRFVWIANFFYQNLFVCIINTFFHHFSISHTSHQKKCYSIFFKKKIIPNNLPRISEYLSYATHSCPPPLNHESISSLKQLSAFMSSLFILTKISLNTFSSSFFFFLCITKRLSTYLVAD